VPDGQTGKTAPSGKSFDFQDLECFADGEIIDSEQDETDSLLHQVAL
jgi:hypothetical protein